MKNLLLIVCLFLLAATTIAQKEEGHVKYDVDISSDNPDNEMAIGMMDGMTMDIYFKDEFVRSDIKMGMMMTIQSISNTDDGQTLMLMSGMIGKKAIVTTEEELDSKNSEVPEMDIQLIDETKEIAGFECKKAILTDDDGMEMTYWYTDKIEINVSGNQFMNNQIPGFPMEMHIEANDMLMVFTVTEYNKKVKNSEDIFDMTIPKGYDEMTVEELGQMGM